MRRRLALTLVFLVLVPAPAIFRTSEERQQSFAGTNGSNSRPLPSMDGWDPAKGGAEIPDAEVAPGFLRSRWERDVMNWQCRELLHIRSWVGVGVAGETSKPDNLFIYYVPRAGSTGLNTLYFPSHGGLDQERRPRVLSVFPYSSIRLQSDSSPEAPTPIRPTQIRLPPAAYGAEGKADSFQAKPKVAILCNVWRQGRRVDRIKPRWAVAFNDMSINNLPGMEKISEQKNWGLNSKGIAGQAFNLEPRERLGGSDIDGLVLQSFLKPKGGEWLQYTTPTMTDYTTYGDALMKHTLERLENQKSEGVWENMADVLSNCDKAIERPQQVLISIGAENYASDLGEKKNLQDGDEVLIVLHDSNYAFYQHDNPHGQISDMLQELADGKRPTLMSVLHQVMITHEKFIDSV